jgi:transcription antitermination factor NusG
MVAQQLSAKTVRFLLPTYLRTVRWSDRLQRGLAPLFPGYIFVHASHAERVCVLQTSGVVNIVSVGGRPCPLSAAEIEMVRRCGDKAHELEPHPYLRIGQRVRVTHGPFTGWEGILVQKKNSTRLVVSVEQIMRSVSVDLAGADVEAVN